ncbi:MAG TPA: DNA polymerase III subunit beta [Limnochordia bacterium]
MQFRCRREHFVQGLSTVERAVSTRATMPILACVLIESDGERLRLSATDLELGVQCSVPAEISEAGTIAVDGKYLTQIVRKADSDTIDVRKLPDEHVVELHAARARFSLQALPPDEFPGLPDVEHETPLRLLQRDLWTMIRQTIFATLDDDSRPFLTGILFEIEQDRVRLASTDMNRLALASGRLIAPAERPRTALIPARALAEVQRILDPRGDTEVEFALGENLAAFRVGGASVVCRLIESQFVNYRQVLPKDQKVQVRVEREPLLAAIDRVSVLTPRGEAIVHLQIENGSLGVSAREAEIGQAYEEIPAESTGGPVKIAFRAAYMIDVLRALDCEQIQFSMTDELRPGDVRAVGDDGFWYIVMPVRVG